jgi:hypothetical protein
MGTPKLHKPTYSPRSIPPLRLHNSVRLLISCTSIYGHIHNSYWVILVIHVLCRQTKSLWIINAKIWDYSLCLYVILYQGRWRVVSLALLICTTSLQNIPDYQSSVSRRSLSVSHRVRAPAALGDESDVFPTFTRWHCWHGGFLWAL